MNIRSEEWKNERNNERNKTPLLRPCYALGNQRNKTPYHTEYIKKFIVTPQRNKPIVTPVTRNKPLLRTSVTKVRLLKINNLDMENCLNFEQFRVCYGVCVL